jgi:hypothetical protein
MRLVRALPRIPAASQLPDLVLQNIAHSLQTNRNQRLDHRNSRIQIQGICLNLDFSISYK